MEEHELCLKIVLGKFERKEVECQVLKMRVLAWKSCILGQVVSKEEISIDPSKVEAISQWK